MQSSAILEKHLEIFNDREKKLCHLLIELDQVHLFKNWPEPGIDSQDKRRLLSQLIHIDESYPGGLRAYIQNARELLAASKRGDNPYDGYTPEVPDGVKLDFASEKYLEAEELGMKEMCRTGFILVAGGLGERLGYSGIKLALPSDICTEKPFLQLYIDHILALEKKSNALNGSDEKIPLVLMTSGDTDTLTRSFLEDNKYFGMDTSQLFIIKQEKVPSLIDNDAHFNLSEEDPYLIESKPHGHGDVHMLLHQSGLARTWQQSGVKWLVFFQDTNAVVFNKIPAAVGISVQNNYDMNTLTVPRSAGEAAGGIAKLKRPDGSSLTINVEYNQLDPLLKSTTQPEGDVADKSGYSPFPGNTNVLIMEMNNYHNTLERSGGAVPEFVNPKYADDKKNTFLKATRLESMMQDIPKLFPPEAKVGFTQFNRRMCFSAVKNNIVDAAKKAEAGLPPESASTGEADIYFSHIRRLEAAGTNIQFADRTSWAGITVENGPKIILSPAFACSIEEIKRKVKRAKISPRSTLILDGEHITIDGLELDGTLIIRSVPEAHVHFENFKIENKGWEFQELEDSETEPEVLRIRGYKLLKHEQCLLEYNEAGSYSVSD